MPERSALTLADIAGRLEMLRVACRKCDRAGQYRVLRLIRECGEDMPLPTWLARVSADCPKRKANDIHDLCGAHCPDLPSLPHTRRTRPPTRR